MISIIIPTYNESQNLPVLIPTLSAVLSARSIEFEIIVVDDNSPDGTADVAIQMAESFPVRCIKRFRERGLSPSVLEGFSASKGTICVVMDADLSHAPESVPDLVVPIMAGLCEATVGSRYVKGGDSSGWSYGRRLISRWSGLLARGVTKLSDPTSGFMAIRKDLLEDKVFDPIGWKIVLEIITKTNAKTIEVPIVFQERLFGESKLSLRIQLQYLQHIWSLYNSSLPEFFQFIKFCAVGMSGVMLDTAALFCLVAGLGLDPRIGSFWSFLLAVSWNFGLNWRWTFLRGDSIWFPRYLRFVSVCMAGFSIRIIVMHLMMAEGGMGIGLWYLVANAIGIIAAALFNYLGSKFLAFSQND